MTKHTVTKADYLDWQSELSLEQVFEGSESFSYPQFYESGLIYLTQIKKQNSRSVLMLKHDGVTRCLTPDGFSLRTKINEYGGKPFWLHDRQLYFVNQDDQCLYHQVLPSISKLLQQEIPHAKRISPKPSTRRVYMFSDVIVLDEHRLAMIVEQENPGQRTVENISYLASIDLLHPDKPPHILQSGADFYSNFVVDQKRQRLAWVQWQHPFMPWDNTQLFYGEYTVDGNEVDGTGDVTITHSTLVDLGAPACICQLLFANNGHLFFSADFSQECAQQIQHPKTASADKTHSDYWNVFSYAIESRQLRQVTNLALEFGYPHWQYGDSRIVQLSNTKILAIGSAPYGDKLFEIDQTTLQVSELEQPVATVQGLASDGSGHIALLRLAKATYPSLIVLQPTVSIDKADDQTADTLIERVEIQHHVDIDVVSVAQHLTFAGADGENAHGYYYPPGNSAYESDAPPPLIVLVHGGPTARAYGHFDIQKQFWTSRGFALFDVNHRGSSGYGRAYRDALYGQWGELDTSDIAMGISMLIKQGMADAERICIRGKSAGGYAVLRALTEYPDMFKAGACYYGIGNLATLAQATHKFEKYYTDRLIDETYQSETADQPSSQFYQRSPIHKISKLKSAMIIFQGLQDKVVPPRVAREVVASLKASGLEHVYIEYADEAHGFRQAENNIDAWGKELAFYQRILAH